MSILSDDVQGRGGPLLQGSGLTNSVTEFIPYVFQLLALLIESNPSAPLPERYQALIGPLLAPVLWESRGNVPALVRLLQAITTRAASVIITQGRLEPILGIFQKLISSKLNEAHAFDLLEAIVVNFQVYATFLVQLYMPKLTML